MYSSPSNHPALPRSSYCLNLSRSRSPLVLSSPAYSHTEHCTTSLQRYALSATQISFTIHHYIVNYSASFDTGPTICHFSRFPLDCIQSLTFSRALIAIHLIVRPPILDLNDKPSDSTKRSWIKLVSKLGFQVALYRFWDCDCDVTTWLMYSRLHGPLH